MTDSATHILLQYANPTLHELAIHAPFAAQAVLDAPDGHAAHAPLHKRYPALQLLTVHAPLVQAGLPLLAVQLMHDAPHWLVLLATQLPPQLAKPELQLVAMHWPEPLQVVVAAFAGHPAQAPLHSL